MASYSSATNSAARQRAGVKTPRPSMSSAASTLMTRSTLAWLIS